MLLFVSGIVSTPVLATTVVPFDPSQAKTDSPVIITSYAFHGPKVSYVQIFNTSDEVVNLDNWQLSYKISGQDAPVVIAALHGLLKPAHYVVVADSIFLAAADFGYSLAIPAGLTTSATSINLESPNYLTHSVALKADTHSDYWQRNVSTSTGNYLSTFAFFIPPTPFTLYGNGLYTYPDQTNLQVSEVLANPRGCSPLDTDLACRDYVKLFNPGDQSVDLSQFRLRVGYQGQSGAASNTFTLGGVIDPGHYAVITTSADDRPLTITNTGGFIWLEDIYGIKRYDNTVQEYADASSDNKKGQAWAYDGSDGQWKWTTQPTPSDRPSVFPVLPVKVTAMATSALKPCREDQYRSEETNRCRSLASLATATLAPCDEDQERNPVTHRCRKVALANAQQLTPCKEGQQRNPTTNRCRNVTSKIPDAAYVVEPVKDTAKAFAGWWTLGGVGILAAGYGAWEWRSEMAGAVRKIASFFTSGK